MPTSPRKEKTVANVARDLSGRLKPRGGGGDKGEGFEKGGKFP